MRILQSITKPYLLLAFSVFFLSCSEKKITSCYSADYIRLEKDITSGLIHRSEMVGKLSSNKIYMECLADSLEITPTDSIDLSNIWKIRALRCVTGEKFFSSMEISKSEIQDQNRYAFLSAENDGIPYFATWMSRDKVYLAPERIQQDIIMKWKKYIKNYYLNESNLNDCVKDITFWYF